MTEREPIYLDHAATTPMRPEVLEAMLPYFSDTFGNPSSIHAFGRAAKMALTAARDRMADALGCSPSELVFTSGGTESDNMAVIGGALAAAKSSDRRRVVASAVEHHAVLHACEELERQGFEVVYAPVDSTGRVDEAAIEALIDDRTALVSVMYANNEVGTLQPIERIGSLAKQHGALFHVDAVQALGSVRIHLAELPVDLMSFSAHKINGPKGIGGLYVNRRVKLKPHTFGGSQERNRRAGTENVPGAVGFAKAVELAVQELDTKNNELQQLREAMLGVFKQLLPSGAFVVNGHPDKTNRLPHILNVSFPGTNTESLLMNLDLEGIAASSGSACSAGALEPSHVLAAMGLPDELLRSAIRFSFGRMNCLKSVTFSAEKVATIVKRLT